MEYTCEIKKQNPTPTICVRTTTSVENLPMVLGQSWGALGAYMEQNGAQPAGVPYVAYFNMDMQNLSVEIGFPLAEPLEGAGALLAATMPDADVAVTMHAGPYTELGAAYRNYRARGPGLLPRPWRCLSRAEFRTLRGG
mgnify:CR=1 FL=1